MSLLDGTGLNEATTTNTVNLPTYTFLQDYSDFEKRPGQDSISILGQVIEGSGQQSQIDIEKGEVFYGSKPDQNGNVTIYTSYLNSDDDIATARYIQVPINALQVGGTMQNTVYTLIGTPTTEMVQKSSVVPTPTPAPTATPATGAIQDKIAAFKQEHGTATSVVAIGIFVLAVYLLSKAAKIVWIGILAFVGWGLYKKWGNTEVAISTTAPELPVPATANTTNFGDPNYQGESFLAVGTR